MTNGDVEKQMYTVVCSCIVPFCACWTHLCLDRKMLCVKCTLLWQKKELYVPTEKNSVCVVHSSAPTEEEEEEEEEEKKKRKEKKLQLCVGCMSMPQQKNALCIVVHFSVQTEKKKKKRRKKKREGGLYTTQKDNNTI